MGNVVKKTNSFRLVNLKGGETPEFRQQLIDEALLGINPVNVNDVIWHFRKQYKGRSVRYIAVGTDDLGNKWFANIAVGHDKSFLEIRAFGPLDHPCTKDVVSVASVPVEVQMALKNVFNIKVLSPSELRFKILFCDD